jgi:hypothetical protein
MKVRYAVIDGMVMSENRNGVISYYSHVPAGNTIVLRDSTGNITDTFEYFPSGTIARRTGTNPTPFLWNGGNGYYQDTPKRVHVRERNFYVKRSKLQTKS